jgi:uncharacterized protein YjiS (DUF1127 family)
MIFLTLHRPVSAAAGCDVEKNSVADGARGVRRTIARWFARSRQRRALREIAESNDFHLLKDIGVSQEEEFREADKPFWRR